jgi:type II secretory pathway component GspD/PulD (secretin)
MLDPRSSRIARLTAMGAVVGAGVLFVTAGCSSDPKAGAPAASKAPATAPKPTTPGSGTTTAKVDPKAPAKPADPKAAPAAAKPPEPAKPAPTAAKPPEPAKPAPTAAKPPETKPEAKKPAEPAKAPEPKPVGNTGEFPPAPPVTVQDPPKRVDPVEKEVSLAEAEKASQELARAAAAKEAAAKEAAAREAAAGSPAVVTPPVKVLTEDEKTLKALSEERKIEIERMKFLAKDFTARGEEAYAALRHQDAKEWALKALENDSGYKPARDLLVKSRAALGERTGDVADLAREMGEARKIKMEMAMEQARTLNDQGQAHLARSNYEGAVQAFDSCLGVIQNFAYDVSWGDLKARAEKGLRDAKEGRGRAEEAARRKAAADAYAKVKQQELERLQAEQKKFDSLMGDAYAAYDRDDHALAEDLAGQALDMRPTDSRAAGLKQSAARGRHGQATEQTRLREKEQFRKWKLEMEESMVPYSDVLNGPSREHWDRITRLRKDLGQVTSATEEAPEAAALKNRLSGESTSFAFDGQTLSEAVQYLSARHNINIVVDDQVKADADAQPLPTVKLTNIPLKDAIELLLTNVAGLTYRVRGNVVFITKPELAREQPIIRIHPVGDLTMKINHFIPPNLVLKPAGAEADENNPQFGKTEEGTPTYGSAEDLIALIKDNVGETPEVWNADGVSIDAQADANILVVAEPALQDGVARFLRDLRKFSGLVVNIESRFLSVSDNFLRDVGVDIRGLGGNTGTTASLDDVTNGLDDGASGGLDNGGVGVPANSSGKPSSGAFFNDNSDGDYRGRTENIFDGGLSSTLTNIGGAVVQWTLLDDTQLSVIWRAVEKKQEGRILQSPNLTVYNTQRANITLINQLAFVQDFDVEVAQTAFIADPQISIIQDGLDLDVKPIVSNDRRYVTLQLQPTIATLKRPIQTFTTSLGAFTSPVTLQLPEINIQKAQTTVRVPNGGTLLIGGLKNISSQDLKSGTPILSRIPIVSFFFSRRASSQDMSNLLIVIRARITDLSEEEIRWAATGPR